MSLRRLSVLLVACLAVLLVGALSACGPAEETTTTSAAPASSTESTTPPSSGETSSTETTAGEELGYFEFNLSMHDPITSNNGQFYQAWADAIAQETNGHVKITIHPSGSLAAAADVAEMVEAGAVDIGWVFTSFYPGQFPLTDVTTVPMIGFGDAVVTTNVLWDLYDKYDQLKKEWERYKLLNLYGNPGMIFCSVDAPIDSPDDLKGLVMRAPAGLITELLKKLGASPVVMAPPDMYEALEKRNITAYVFEPAGITNFKLQDVTKYFTDMPLYDGAFGLVMNWDKWNSLPPQYQQIIEKHCLREGSLAAAQNFSEAAAKARQTIADAGGQWVTVTPENKAAFQKVADEVAATWPSTIKIEGFDAAAYMQDAIALCKQYSGQ